MAIRKIRRTAALLVLASLSACGGGGAGTPSLIDVGRSRGLAITSGPPPSGTVGAAYTPVCYPQHPGDRCGIFSFSGSGSASFTWTWAAAPGSSLPPGLSIAGNRIIGTPPVGSVGSYSVLITATDGGMPPGAVTQAYTITIGNPPPPVIAALPGPPGATLNQPYSYQFPVSGVAPISVSETGTLPPGLAPPTSTGLLTGTPTSANSYPITLHATDASGQGTSQAYTIDVFAHGFSPTGAMQAPRSGHTATLLASGQVLVAGGESTAGSVTTSELFDPTTGRFATTGGLQVARAQHTATLLCDLAAPPCPNPKVLLVGGGISASTFGTAELYDPTAGTFTLTGSLVTGRASHTATRLLSGKVLITGGADHVSGSASTSAELFDPGTGTFSATAGPMTHGRSGHTATLLSDGRVLIAGGDDFTSGPLNSAEIYDPALNAFRAVPSPMTAARYGHTATLLPGGKVLIAGGASDPIDATLVMAAELYDPVAVAPTSSFIATNKPVTQRSFHNAVWLPQGQVLIVGGIFEFPICCQVLQHAELYDPASGLFAPTGGMQTGRTAFTLTLLGTGDVLAVGGNDSVSIDGFSSAEVYR